MTAHDASRRSGRDLPLAIGSGVLALALLVLSPTNNPFEGWGMLLRAVAGQALVVVAAHFGARAVNGRSSPRARHIASLVSSVVLFPFAGVALLMSKEGGESWALASLSLLAWFLVAGIVALVLLVRSRDRRPG